MNYLEKHRCEIFKKYDNEELIKDINSFKSGSGNLNKTLNASVEQIDAIRKLQQNGKFNKLEDNLKEIANLRLENPDMPLLELGKLLKNPVGKSGVNYRLKKIIEIANEN